MNKYVLLPASVSALMAVGCGTLPEVVATQKYAKMQEQAADVFPRIANDFYGSCMRSASYTLLNDPPKVLDLERARTEEVCELVALKTKKAVNDTNSLILGYLSSLGNLATGEAVDYKPQVEEIGKSLQSLPGLGTDESIKTIDAGTSLATFLFKLFASGYQKQQLGQSIRSYDNQLQVLVGALSSVVEKDYIGRILQVERIALDSYYRLPIGIAKAQPRKSSIDEYVEYSLNSAWLEKQEIIRGKQAAAKNYISLLKQVSCDHSKLKDLYMNDSSKTSENSNPYCPKADPSIGHAGIKNTSISDILRQQKLIQSLDSYSVKLTKLTRLAERVYPD